MDIIVCVKHVPQCADVELKIDESGRDIVKAGLAFDINEWDDYALEEAVRLKERFGGTVTAITVGSKDADSTLRKCLARGADHAIRVYDPRIEGSDAYVIAKILHRVIRNMKFDLILTGVQAGDDGSAVVGPALARLLGVPHATLVKKIELSGNEIIVDRELEGGLMERLRLRLPALLTIQSGINEPRYASIMSIRRAMQKEIKVFGLADLGLSESDVGYAGSWTVINKLYIPPAEKKAEIISGSPEEIAKKIVEILKSRGLL